MSELNISIPSGESKRLLTGGKLCPDNIVVTAEELVEKDVNFYDYDGTLLYSYTLEEAQALTELPPIPNYHEHLIPYGWNWSLEDVTTLDTVADIGAMYDTEDGATYIGLEIIDINNATVVVNFKSGNPTISWGDGAVTESATTGVSHTYSAIGAYEIKVTGSHRLGGGTNSTALVSGSGCKNVVYVYADSATGAEQYSLFDLPNLETANWPASSYARETFRGDRKLKFFVMRNTDLPYAMFYACNDLRLVSAPKALAYVHGESLRGCAGLKRFSAKNYLLWDGNYHFYGCSRLNPIDIRANAPIMVAYGCYGAREITIHEGVTSIAQQACYNCYNTEVFSIASTVTSIAAQAFQNSSGAVCMRFLSAAPPTVANANAFTGIPRTCVVEVPAASLTAYQNATNYGSIAAQMVGV